MPTKAESLSLRLEQLGFGHVLRSLPASPQEVAGKERTRRVTWARYALWHAMYTSPARFSFPDIARIFGTDHTTVMGGVKAHEKRYAKRVRHPDARCVRLGILPEENGSWCGREPRELSTEWCFQDAGHAALSGRAGNAVRACLACVLAIKKALNRAR